MKNNQPYALYKVKVQRCTFISPNVKRITIDCSSIKSIRPSLPAQWLKIFIYDDKKKNKIGRAYTVRNFNKLNLEMDLDIYLHKEPGPISSWAINACIGSEFEISELRARSGKNVYSDSSPIILFGDESALPAISAIIEAMPKTRKASAFISLMDLQDKVSIKGLNEDSIVWLHREKSQSGRIAEEIINSNLSFKSDSEFWIAGESSEVKAIRKILLEQGINPNRIEASGYWKYGQADHR